MSRVLGLVFFLSILNNATAGDLRLEAIRFENRLLAFELFQKRKAILEMALKKELKEESDSSADLVASSLVSSGGVSQTATYVVLASMMAGAGDDGLFPFGNEVSRRFLLRLAGVLLLHGGGALVFDSGVDHFSASDHRSAQLVYGEYFILGGYTLIATGSMISAKTAHPLFWWGAKEWYPPDSLRLGISSVSAGIGAYCVYQGISIVTDSPKAHFSVRDLLAHAPLEDPKLRRTARFFGLERAPKRLAILSESFENGEFDLDPENTIESLADPMGESLIGAKKLKDYFDFRDQLVALDEANGRSGLRVGKEEGWRAAVKFHSDLSKLLIGATRELKMSPREKRRIRMRVRDSERMVSQLI